MPFPTRRGGFTLVELAIVLLIVALLSGGAIATLRLQTERSHLIDAKDMITEAREALLNYAAVTGGLPCPDINRDGEPDSCSSSEASRGELPWKTLALQSADPWGQTLHYAVQGRFTVPASITLGSLGGLEIQSDNGNGTIELAKPEAVAMAIWSAGPDATDNSSGTATKQITAESPRSDDLVLWVSRYIVIGRMVEAGRDLPQ